jgi:hypothetical protein
VELETLTGAMVACSFLHKRAHAGGVADAGRCSLAAARSRDVVKEGASDVKLRACGSCVAELWFAVRH